MILLDTNVISELMKASPDLGVLSWLDNNTRNGLFISAISQAEIALGIALYPLVCVRPGFILQTTWTHRKTIIQ